MQIPTWQDIERAAERIAPYAHRTPVLTCTQVDDRAGAKIFFKCENFQKVGAFKFRGACNAVFALSEEACRQGVVTHSSGNHAAALALAARIRGIPAYVVMPENAPVVKKQAVAAYGAMITFCESTQEARESTLLEVHKQTGAVVIHPYDHVDIIAGQGTAAKELLQEVPEISVILAPVGGGGLLSGTAIATHSISPQSRVIGCEPQVANDAFRSLHSGILQPSLAPKTIADGLRTSLSPRTFSILQQHVDSIVTVEEHDIIEAMHFVWQRMKIVIEPSSAVPVAALFQGKIRLEPDSKVGVVISGGNVDLQTLLWQQHSF